MLVNQEKVSRAKEILDFVSGKRVPQNEIEESLKARYTQHLATANIAPSGENALEFVYLKLGGLVRTEVEQQAFEKKVAPLRAKSRRKTDD